MIKFEKERITTASELPPLVQKFLARKYPFHEYFTSHKKTKNPTTDNQCIGFLIVTPERLEPPTF
jgi:hypothetical protein